MTRHALLLIWLAFLARGTFHALVLPVWEGIDEYAHVAVIEHWLHAGTVPKVTDQVAPEIMASLARNPLPRALKYLGPSFRSHDEFWEGAAPPPPLTLAPRFDLYEAQQPPLYYWMMLVPYRLAGALSMESRVIVLRLVSVLLACAGIVFGFLAARIVFASDAWALAVAGVMAIFPGLLTDTARIGNDGLTFALFSALLWLLLREPIPRMTGLVLALGLLSKALFLIAIPVAIATLILRRTPWKRAAFILGLPVLLSGWWYVAIHQRTGSWSGWNESALPGVNLPASLTAAVHVNWIGAAQVAFGSWIWFGDWSFLIARRWMYAVCALLFLIAALGLLPRLRRFALPLAFVGCFTAAMAYNVVITYLNHRISATTGWYYSVLLAAEIILLVGGLATIFRSYAAFLATVIFAALDAYVTWFVALPYYAGLTAHHPNALMFSRMHHAWAIPLGLAASILLLALQYRLCATIRFSKHDFTRILR